MRKPTILILAIALLCALGTASEAKAGGQQDKKPNALRLASAHSRIETSCRTARIDSKQGALLCRLSFRPIAFGRFSRSSL